MKGIILAGGYGTRLNPITRVISKQLLPVYDKPMIYYPLSTLMLAGIKDILIITKPEDKILFKNLLDNGNQWGISIKYQIQKKPEGIAQSFIISEKFIKNSNICLILGDNLFFGQDLQKSLIRASKKKIGATIFSYPVNNPSQYGIINFDNNGRPTGIEEKPKKPKSTFAVTGLYFYDSKVISLAKSIKPSLRNELEITSINQIYLKNNALNVEVLERDTAWLDMGTPRSLLEASQFVQTIESRQAYKIACPEEIAWRWNWVNDNQIMMLARYYNNEYGDYLRRIIDNPQYKRKYEY